MRISLQDWLEKSRLHNVYNAIDATVYDNLDIKNYSPQKFLFLGHLSYAKGYCDLLQAIPLILEKYPDSTFYFAGVPLNIERNVLHNQETGEALEIMGADECEKEYLTDNIQHRYVYLDVLDEDQKIRHLQECNALILPSYSEGFSMAVLEAMSMGKPIVCSTVGALKEVVGNGVNGYTFSPGDINALAKGVIQLLDDPVNRDKMALANYNKVRNRCTQEAVAKQLMTIFNHV